MKKVTLTLLAISAFALGMTIDLAGLVSLGLILVCTWLLLLGIVLYLSWYALVWLRVLQRHPSRLLLLGPVLGAILAGICFLGTVVFAPPAVPTSDANHSVEEELTYMLATDQSDRYSGRFFVLLKRDKERLHRVREIMGRHSTSLRAEAMYAAAMILQHGDSATDYQMAHELATQAHEAGLKEAQWLSKATYDRWQIALGQPQRYGTQSKVTFGIGGWQKE